MLDPARTRGWLARSRLDPPRQKGRHARRVKRSYNIKEVEKRHKYETKYLEVLSLLMDRLLELVLGIPQLQNTAH